ncbi:MAG TPA: hypothetical protein V6D47_12120 [Oscillatoriaceae cyanobacterium]
MTSGTGKLTPGTGPLKKAPPPKQESWFDHAMDVVHEAGHVAGTVVGAAGTIAHKGISLTGDVVGGAIHLGGEGIAYGLDHAGMHHSAHAIEAASKALDHVTREFADGAGEAIGGIGTGLKETIEHPIKTVKNIARLATHPKLLAETGKAIWKEAKKGGWAHAAGYIAGSVAPVLLSGGVGAVADAGEAAGAVGIAGEAAEGVGTAGEVVAETAVIGKNASLLAKVGATMAKQEGVIGSAGKGVLQVADKGGKVMDVVETVANPQKLVGKVAGKVADHFFGGASEPVGGAAKEVAEVAEKAPVTGRLEGHLEKVAARLDGKNGVISRAALKVQKETLEDVVRLKNTGVKGLVGEARTLGGHAVKLRFSELMDTYAGSGVEALVSRGSEAAKLIMNPLETLSHSVMGELDYAGKWAVKQTANVVNGEEYAKKLA